VGEMPYRFICIFIILSFSVFAKGRAGSPFTCKSFFGEARDIDFRIVQALRSRETGVRLEGEVARAIRKHVMDFRHKIAIPYDNRIIGEIDIETLSFIIEVKSGNPYNIEIGQAKRLAYNPRINPLHKQVLIFSSRKWSREQEEFFYDQGFLVFSSLDDLIYYLDRFEPLPDEPLLDAA
jgi:hypothetical protein